MKTIAQTLLAALLLAAPALSSTAKANNRADEPTTTNNVVTTTNTFRVAVYGAAKPMTIKVVVDKQMPQSMTIRVVDQRGTTLEEQTIGRRQGTFQYRFDLSELADGNYSVEVISGTDKSSYPITLTTPTTDRTITVQ
jgi:hypothetical protein